MSTWKNILTLGNHGKLQKEIDQFKSVSEYYTCLEGDFKPLIEVHKASAAYLQTEREAAIKNLFLVKTLIKRIKNNVDEKGQELKLDDFIKVEISKDNKVNDNLDVDVNFNWNNVGGEFVDSLNDSLGFLSSKKSISTKDLKTEAILVGIDALGAALDSVLEINSQVNEQRAKIQEQLSKVSEAIDNIQNYYPEIYFESSRALEIAGALNMANQVFSRQFTAVHDKLFNKSKWRLFWEEFRNIKILITDEDKYEIQKLMLACSSYNKIYQQNIK